MALPVDTGGSVAYAVTELSKAAVARIEARMRPGALLASGFLTPGESLVDVIARDVRALAEIGVETATVADRLEGILVAAHERAARLDRQEEQAHPGEYPAGTSVLVEARYRVIGFGHNVRGLWPCPFELPNGVRCGGYEKGLEFRNQSFTIHNTVRQVALPISVFVIHLIREHDFFEGDVEYRVDPIVAATVLDLIDGPAP